MSNVPEDLQHLIGGEITDSNLPTKTLASDVHQGVDLETLLSTREDDAVALDDIIPMRQVQGGFLADYSKSLPPRREDVVEKALASAPIMRSFTPDEAIDVEITKMLDGFQLGVNEETGEFHSEPLPDRQSYLVEINQMLISANPELQKTQEGRVLLGLKKLAIEASANLRLFRNRSAGEAERKRLEAEFKALDQVVHGYAAEYSNISSISKLRRQLSLG